MCRECFASAALAAACSERRSDFVRQQYLFSDLSEERLETVFQRMVVERLTADSWLFLQSDPAERFYLVEEGELALVRYSENGEEVIVAIVGPGETLSEEILLPEVAHHSVGCRALTECAVIGFDARRLGDLLDEPGFLRKLMTTMHRRNQILLDEIERQALQSATDRLLDFLLREASRGRRGERVSLSYPKRTLASRLSIKPETLSRIFARLRDCRVLEMHGNEIVLDQNEARRTIDRCGDCTLAFWGCPGEPARSLAARSH